MWSCGRIWPIINANRFGWSITEWVLVILWEKLVFCTSVPHQLSSHTVRSNHKTRKLRLKLFFFGWIITRSLGLSRHTCWSVISLKSSPVQFNRSFSKSGSNLYLFWYLTDNNFLNGAALCSCLLRLNVKSKYPLAAQYNIGDKKSLWIQPTVIDCLNV